MINMLKDVYVRNSSLRSDVSFGSQSYGGF